MNTLNEIVDLNGEIEQITLGELRKNPGEVFSQVELGKTFRITRKGKPVAHIAPYEHFDQAAFLKLRKQQTKMTDT